MKVRLTILILIFSVQLINGQTGKVHIGISQWHNDSLPPFERILGYTDYIWDELMFSHTDSAYSLLKNVETFAIENNDIQGLGYIYNQIGVSHGIRGNLSEAIDNFKLGAEKVLEVADNEMYIYVLSNLAHAYQQAGLLSKALESLKKLEDFAESTNTPYEKDYHNEVYGTIYLSQGKLTEAKRCFTIAIETYSDSIGIGTNYKYLGDAYQQEGNIDSALYYYQKALDIHNVLSKSNACQTALSIGTLYFKAGNIEAAKIYMDQALIAANSLNLKDESTGALMLQGQINRAEAKTSQAIDSYSKALAIAEEGNHLINQQESAYQLYELYKKVGNTVKALSFFEQSKILSDSIKNDEVKKQLQLLNFRNQIRQDSLQLANTIQTNQIRYESTLRSRNFIVFILLIILMGLVAFAYYQNRAKKVKENLLEQVQEQHQKVTAMNEEIIKTKDQLVVQEKLASLGQLTAGIAHEIKNPLNFITNFSEDSTELIEELDHALKDVTTQLPAKQQQLILTNLNDLKLNTSDILENGVRLNQIVTNMMNHSRTSQITKSPEDINNLVEINVNFAFNAFKANNLSFATNIVKEFAPDLPELEVYPQELGRVVLNLINNACYATLAKFKTNADFSPQIKVSTNLEQDHLSIKVWDNGTGISQGILPNIFNPFFTTKSTGEGNTGLGLSISYDIVSNLHQGQITVDSEEGVYTEFTILIPRG